MAGVDKELLLIDPFFAMEDESNINDRVLPMPMEPPPSLVAQEESRPHQKMAQIVFSTPHRPRQRMEGGEMLCVVLCPHTLTSQHTAIAPLHTNRMKGAGPRERPPAPSAGHHTPWRPLQ